MSSKDAEICKLKLDYQARGDAMAILNLELQAERKRVKALVEAVKKFKIINKHRHSVPDMVFHRSMEKLFEALIEYEKGETYGNR